MLVNRSRQFWLIALGVSLVASASVGACGGSNGGSSSATSKSTSTSTGMPSTSSGGMGGMGGLGGGSSTTFVGPTGSGGNMQGFDVEPAPLQTITVMAGNMTPTVPYTATANGSPVNATWTVDRVDIAGVPIAPASNAAITPTGKAGGLVTLSASYNGQTLTRQIMVKLDGGTQNGATSSEGGQVATPGMLTQGGGVGGVGGEGLGPPAMNFPTPTMPAAMGLKMLYPYDKTVWPRGMLAPLLMWNWTPGDADAIQIKLSTTSGSFTWTGTFGRPAVLGMGGAPSNFIRHPIPQDVWDMATNSAGGATPPGVTGPDKLTMSLTVAKGGVAYGPLTETWTIAPGRLAGTVYYNSYGTRLVSNSRQTSVAGSYFGAAVLGIKGGATGPAVVAGYSDPPSQIGTGVGCRVCHVVSADGSRLDVQDGYLEVYDHTSTYDLKNANTETILTNYPNTFGWAGLYPDGSLAMLNTADLAASGPASQLYAFPPAASGATPLAVTGIPSDLQAGTPTFSPDGKHVAFELLGGTVGTLTGTTTGASQLVALDFDKATMTFSNVKLLANLAVPHRAGFPSFFPTNDAVAFHYQILPSNHRYNTWNKATAQIWWTDLATGTATPLAALNGFDLASKTSYLPTGGTNHTDDTILNYEPTVNPIVTGGYAWIIFTSRRLYGNLATNDPWLSDPRNYDDTVYANVTSKKLWVAAVDIGSIQNGKFMEGVPPGTDPSHPAFYLGGQELVAGNARGFWVLDPCKADGMSCETGDQCCNGFCEPNTSGMLVCGPPPMNTCSGLQEKCTKASDCCSPQALCINGFCALGGPT